MAADPCLPFSYYPAPGPPRPPARPPGAPPPVHPPGAQVVAHRRLSAGDGHAGPIHLLTSDPQSDHALSRRQFAPASRSDSRMEQSRLTPSMTDSTRSVTRAPQAGSGAVAPEDPMSSPPGTTTRWACVASLTPAPAATTCAPTRPRRSNGLRGELTLPRRGPRLACPSTARCAMQVWHLPFGGKQTKLSSARPPGLCSASSLLAGFPLSGLGL